MSGEYYEIGTQIASDHTSAARLVSRTATRRSHKTIPFEGPERQHAVEMIERMAAGDEVALAAFYQRFAPMLYGLALKMMKDEKEAEDVLQEGFVYLWRKAAASSPCVEPSVEQRTRILASIAATPQLARQTAETSLPDGYSFVPNSSDG
jgi:hypothetical protein